MILQVSQIQEPFNECLKLKGTEPYFEPKAPLLSEGPGARQDCFAVRGGGSGGNPETPKPLEFGWLFDSKP